MPQAYLTGLGAFLPNDPVDNEHIESVLGSLNARSSQVKQWVLGYNGIETRYYALDPVTHAVTHTNAQMTKSAILAALSDAGRSYSELECLACGTSSPDQILPAHGVMVHGELGEHPLEVATTSGVCCSGMSAFKYAYMNVACGFVRSACATGSELASVSLRAEHFQAEMAQQQLADVKREPMLAFENEFLRWMLSDGAGAAVITDTPRASGLSLRIDWMEFASYAHEAPPCMYFGCVIRKDGTVEGLRLIDDPNKLLQMGYLSLTQNVEVLRKHLPEGFRKICLLAQERHHLQPDNIDWLLPHYSSEGFRQPLMDGLAQGGFAIPEEKWFTNLKSKGNTGSASIYIILEELMHSGRVKVGDRLVCAIPESSRFSFAILHLTAVGPSASEIG